MRQWRDDVGRATLSPPAATLHDRGSTMRLRRTATWIALSVAANGAMADRSLLGQDEDGVEAGDCQAELAFERSRFRDAPVERERGLQLSCGIGWRSELTLTAARMRSEGASTDKLALEWKKTLLPRRERKPGWAAIAKLAGEKSPGASWRRSEYALAIEAAAKLRETWLVEARLGWSRDLRAATDRTTWTLGSEHALAPAWETRLELEGDDRDPPVIGASLRWAFWPEVAQVTLSWNRRLGADRERKLGLALGVEF